LKASLGRIENCSIKHKSAIKPACYIAVNAAKFVWTSLRMQPSQGPHTSGDFSCRTFAPR
jgi:hypothetical protein